MATASFKTLSPKTREYRVTSTFKSLNIANIVTGSVGEIIAPNVRASKKVKESFKLIGRNWTHPYIKALKYNQHYNNITINIYISNLKFIAILP